MLLLRTTATRLHETPRRSQPLALLALALLWPFLGATVRAQGPMPRRTLTGHHFEVYSMAFSPDGKTLASGGGYLSSDLKPGEIMLWEMDTGKRLRSLTGHTGGVWSVAFSPDGKTLASSSADKTIKLWDVSSGKEKATLEGHREWVRSIAFSPDGKALASASNDTTVKVWSARSGWRGFGPPSRRGESSDGAEYGPGSGAHGSHNSSSDAQAGLATARPGRGAETARTALSGRLNRKEAIR